MMYANYHTHTYRCRHATGTEREYIETAIAAGIRILGFSDHAPCIFDDALHAAYGEGRLRGKYYSNFRMEPGDAEGYFRKLGDLRDEYRGEIEIHIGLEMEYYPRYFEKTVRFLENFPCEYLILGQHVLDNEIGPRRYSSMTPTDNPDIYRQYISEVEEGMATGKYLYLAHPDLLYYTGDAALRRELSTRLCESARRYDMPLEINLLGLSAGRNYPRDTFWEIAAKTGNRTVIGADAHKRAALQDEATYRKALSLCDSLGLSPEKRLELR